LGSSWVEVGSEGVKVGSSWTTGSRQGSKYSRFFTCFWPEIENPGF